MSQPSNYADAGVDRDQEEKAVKLILNMIKSTYTQSDIPEGHFAGSIPLGNYLLSLANDGVGTKLILAQELGKLDTIGIDAVAMCVNDLITIGSIPSAFVDYIAIMEPTDELIVEIMKGLVEGCIQAEVPLVGGETATVPDILKPVANDNGFDVAGTALGVHKKDNTISGKDIQVGDKIIAVESNGVHSNGLTLARKLLKERNDQMELLRPTRIYVKMVKALLENIKPHGMAHITGGGVTNLLRLGPYHYCLNKLNLLPENPIFSKLEKAGNLTLYEQYRTFNMGFGFVIIVSSEDEIETLKILNDFYPAFTVGQIKAGNKVTVELGNEILTYEGS